MMRFKRTQINFKAFSSNRVILSFIQSFRRQGRDELNILIVEDEYQLSEALIALLKQNGYSVDAVSDGILGEDYALSGIYDAIVLDIMLPRKNGLQVLKSMRERGLSTPVLLLTAKSEIEDKIHGLDTGADDYLTKPFVSGELLARIRALTRRKGEFTGDELSFGGVQLNLKTHTLHSGSGKVRLGLKEFQIMEILLQNSSQIVERETFIEKIWGFDSEAEYNAVEVYISFLRKKLVAIKGGIGIKAVRGVGYALEESV